MTLDFIKHDTKNVWVAKFPSEGSVVVQVRTAKRCRIAVTANFPGLPSALVNVYENPYTNGGIFIVDLPTGLDVTIQCNEEVLSAQMDYE